jgi:GntR family transcriptional regulator
MDRQQLASLRRFDGDARTTPKYYRLKQELRQQIDDLAPGTAIEPERVLSERFAVSRTTVRQALQELAVEGRLVRIQGKGTFVAPPKVTQSLQLTSYTEDIASRGLNPASRLLEITELPTSPEVAAHMQLDVGVPIVRIERLRLADGQPMAVEAVHLEAARFADIAEAMFDWTSLYTLLHDRYGIELVEAEETIETVLASPAEARLLNTDTGSPLLLLSRTSWDPQARPVEYVRSLYRGDRYRFVTRLRRPGPDGG